MFRFIHSSDLHIGKRFGNLPEDLRGRLCEARHTALSRLARQARSNGAAIILLAGDTFDTETPTPQMLHHAMQEMRQSPDLTWVILPGNHDSLLADELWRRARDILPPNVILALEPRPIELAGNVVLLPAPCTTRRPGRDLTEWMSTAATPQGAVRIGLAHGPVLDFSEDGAKGEVIAPNRAALAGLDYLALGDWHGRLSLNERTHYSGSPEPDRFKHGKPGEALLVTIANADAVPEITTVPTANFAWQTRPLELLGEEDGLASLEAALPEPTNRRQTLLRLDLFGHTRIATRTALAARADALAPQFAHFEVEDSQLLTECEASDLERIDHAGALRLAAEALLAQSEDASLSADERTIAQAALMRLFTYCEKIDA
ncbi:exonuclease SbcCD subunit D [uncultured Devosia sp.]|uniref:metallophosphoesterase family protein n=1 Tax=uncultured Devosia sp. TaxID=211434 RepID=UPI0035CA9BB3